MVYSCCPVQAFNDEVPRWGFCNYPEIEKRDWHCKDNWCKNTEVYAWKYTTDWSVCCVLSCIHLSILAPVVLAMSVSFFYLRIIAESSPGDFIIKCLYWATAIYHCFFFSQQFYFSWTSFLFTVVLPLYPAAEFHLDDKLGQLVWEHTHLHADGGHISDEYTCYDTCHT